MTMPPAVPRALRNALISLRALVLAAGPFALLAVGLLVLAYWWLDPTPPRRVTLATGPAQSAYEAFGQRYAKALKAEGIEVVLLPSEGSSANLKLLREGRADLGFVQGGSTDPNAPADEDEDLVSLGSLFVEPVWLFYRAQVAEQVAAARPRAAKDKARTARGQPPRLDTLADLRGLRVNVGTAGSGVPSLMQRLFALNRIEASGVKLSHLAETPAVVEFLAGRLDALVFASAPESPMVQMLLQTPGVRLMDFAQSEAYARRLPFLSPETLPRGVVDLAGDVPARDVRLVAPTAALLAHQDTHPALRQLFAQNAQTIHGGAGWFNRAREYPTTRNSEFPIAKEGERAINEPVPLMQRYLPFWIANLVERMWLVMGILLAALLPLSRVVPPLYAFRIRSRVFRWYAQLRDIEARLETNPEEAPGLLKALGDLESVVSKINVPLSYTDELYSLRNSIVLVREKLQAASAA